MQRNAEATKELILAAAAAKFSAFGYAGARIERIAEASGKIRAMIYAYFENKQGLFDAVFHRVVVSTTAAIPMDVADLPGYAVQLFDAHQVDATPLRLAA